MADEIIKPFSLAMLERDIREMSGEPVYAAHYEPPSHRSSLPALPSYVEPDPDVPEVGRLTAESVVRDYEETAKQIDAMRAELMAAQAEMEKEMAAIHAVNELLRETAQRARDQGKAAFERIQRQAKLTAGIRDQITAISDQLREA